MSVDNTQENFPPNPNYPEFKNIPDLDSEDGVERIATTFLSLQRLRSRIIPKTFLSFYTMTKEREEWEVRLWARIANAPFKSKWRGR